jgi:hypothetical protein
MACLFINNVGPTSTGAIDQFGIFEVCVDSRPRDAMKDLFVLHLSSLSLSSVALQSF